MRIIAVINQKGGSGKTTSVINIGKGLTILKRRVLLIDLDPQAHLTYSLGVKAEDIEESVDSLLTAKFNPSSTIIEKGGLYLIPSSLSLSGVELELSGIDGKEFMLREGLKRIKGSFDYILIDSPPSLGLLTINALTTASEVYIPLQTEFLALQGMSKLLETVEVVKQRLNKGIEITGIIATRFDKRKNLNKEVVGKIKEYFGDKIFKTLIRDNIALAEAPSYGQSIFEYSPKSYGAEDYLNLSKEILKRE